MDADVAVDEATVDMAKEEITTAMEAAAVDTITTMEATAVDTIIIIEAKVDMAVVDMAVEIIEE